MNNTTPLALTITRHGGPEVMKLLPTTQLPLMAGDVRISVAAAGVNFADIMMRMGLYPEAPPPPFVPGYEFSGVVTETAPDVTTFKVGDKVMGGSKFGAYTTEIVVPAPLLRPLPKGLSLVEAASVPVVWLTAWTALKEMARIRAGDRVLVQSAAGGVGIAALQLAKQAQAITTGLTSSPSKTDFIKEYGASDVWLTQEDDAGAHKDARFDIILDSVGGTSLKRNMERLAPGGRIISFGAAQTVSGDKRSLFGVAKFFLQTPFILPLKLMNQNIGVYGLNMLQFYNGDFSGDHFNLLTRALDGITAGFEAGHYKTFVGSTFPLAEAGKAHTHLQSRGNSGKIVLTTT